MSRRRGVISLALAGKAAFDVAMATKLCVGQWTKHKAFGLWCAATATATFATAPLVVDETRRAWSALSSRSDRPILRSATAQA